MGARAAAEAINETPGRRASSALDGRHPSSGAACDRLAANGVAATGDARPTIPSPVEEPRPWKTVAVRPGADRSTDDRAEPPAQTVELAVGKRADSAPRRDASLIKDFVGDP